MRRALIAAVIPLVTASGYAQNTPTLALAAGKAGINGNEFGTASDFEFQMEASGWPRAVTAGETVFMMGSWPAGNDPTMTDDKSNAWAAAPSCSDGTGTSHGFFYAVDAAANTSLITETHATAISNGVFDWAHFYNMATAASGFLEGSSCQTGVTPTSNSAPNLNGTAYSTAAAGDLILVCVYVEQNPLSAPNAISSLAFPAGFTGLSEDTTYGHACAYGVQAAAGPFTPTFTVVQGTHDSFTIMSAAFKAGTGGTAPGNGASVLLSEMHYEASAGNTDTVYLPCPSGTTTVAILDDAAGLTQVTDSNGNGWQHAPFQMYFGPIFYVNDPTIGDGNTYTVSMTFGSDIGGYDLVGLFCIGNTSGVDTAATAQNASTLDGAGSGSTYDNGTISGTTIVDAPSLGTSVAGDLVLDVGAIGVGPATACLAGQCVFDYVGSTSWTDGDNESYANGDLMAHQYASAAATVDFEFDVVNTGAAWSGIALALKPATSVAGSSSSSTGGGGSSSGGGSSGTISGSSGGSGPSSSSGSGAATTGGGSTGTSGGATTGGSTTTGAETTNGSSTGGASSTRGSTVRSAGTSTASSAGSSNGSAIGTSTGSPTGGADAGAPTSATGGCGCGSAAGGDWTLALALGVGGFALRRRRRRVEQR